ncbi:MAG: COG1361 S-layer family protein [Methanoregula sp.]|nr:COG1361 S-layer family protein [Methanoregula sp.]
MAIHMQEKEWHEFRQRERNTTKTAGRPGHWPVAIIALIFLLPFIIAPAAATDPTVIITGYEVTPAVLLPGDMGTITLTIKNTAETASEKENSGIVTGGAFASTKSTDINVFIENVHMEENGIEVLTEDLDRLGELGPGQSVPVTFVIRAPAKSGIYFPEAWIDVKDGRSTRYPVTVNVNTDISTQKKPALFVTQQLPDRVAPGEDCTVDILVKNTGLTRASDISMVVNSTTKSLVLTSTSRYYIEHLDPGEYSSIALHVATDKNTPVGIDPVTLTITYRNPDGTAERQTETVGIPVKGRADIAVSSVTTDPVRPVPGSAFTLIIRVENTGTDQATSVRATLDSPFTGTKTAFIGSIDKDSDAPAIFYLQATKDGPVPANLTISYNDDFGAHMVSEQVTVMTSPASGMLPAALAVLLICIIAGAAYWYLRIRPGKDHA